jgi:threonine synthase
LLARGCPVCRERGDPYGLVVEYDDVEGATLAPAERTLEGIWKHGALLPKLAETHKLTLGEGDTPLVHVPALSEASGCERLFLKMEAANPTAAHKDRFHAISLAVGHALGYRAVISSSTGNHGLSLAAYAAAHRMWAVILCNEQMPLLLQRAIRFVGGLPLMLPWEEASRLMETLVEDDGWYPSTGSWPDPMANHYGVEGYKTIGLELYQQLGGTMPDLVFAPTAHGDGLVGLWRAMVDLDRLGLPHAWGQVCACQPATAAPLVAALDQHLETVPYLPEASSVALSIGDPISGGIALRAVRETGGFGVAVTDEAILETGRLLAANGLVVEPSSAASVCGALQALRDRPELRERTIVCVVTSSGLKWLDAYEAASAEGALRLATAEEGRRAMEGEGFLHG